MNDHTDYTLRVPEDDTVVRGKGHEPISNKSPLEHRNEGEILVQSGIEHPNPLEKRSNEADTQLNMFKNEMLSSFKILRNSIMEDVSSLLKHKSINNDKSDVVSLFAKNDIPEDVSSEEFIPGANTPEDGTDNMSDLFGTKASPSKAHTPHTEKMKDSVDIRVDVYDDILSQLDTEYNTAKELGDTIKPNLADRILSHFLEKAQDTDSKKAIVQRHKLPENCQKIAVPKLRDSVLSMKSFTEYQKRIERSHYNLQTTVLSATCSIISVLNETLVADSRSHVVDTKSLVRNCLDAVTLLGSASHSISVRRKQNLRSALSSQYQPLCNPNRPTSKYLLGDDLQQGMKEAQEASKLAYQKHSYRATGNRNFSSARYTPYPANNTRNHFLENGRKPQKRKKSFPSSSSTISRPPNRK